MYPRKRHKIEGREVKRESERPKLKVHKTTGLSQATSRSRARESHKGVESHAHHSANPPPVKLDSVFISSLSGRTSTKPKTKKKRKNRPSQRARQKLWEELYGSKARHNKKAQVIAKGKGGIQCAAKRYELQSEQVKDASLHPSWEASRRRKEQESKRTPFEGQRTVFSDSD